MSNLKGYYLPEEMTSKSTRRPEKRIIFRDQTEAFVSRVSNPNFMGRKHQQQGNSNNNRHKTQNSLDLTYEEYEGSLSIDSADSSCSNPKQQEDNSSGSSSGSNGKKRRELCPARMEQNKIAARKARLRKKMEFERLNQDLEEKSREIKILQEEKQGLLIHINGLYTRLGQMVAGYASAPEATTNNCSSEDPNATFTNLTAVPSATAESENFVSNPSNNSNLNPVPQQCLFLVNQETISNPLTAPSCYYIPSELMTGMSNQQMPDTLWIHNGRAKDTNHHNSTNSTNAPLYVPAKRSKKFNE